MRDKREELLEALIEFHSIISKRHHGRMPEEVEKSYEKCNDLLQNMKSPKLKGPKLPPVTRG